MLVKVLPDSPERLIGPPERTHSHLCLWEKASEAFYRFFPQGLTATKVSAVIEDSRSLNR